MSQSPPNRPPAPRILACSPQTGGGFQARESNSLEHSKKERYMVGKKFSLRESERQ
jgi:hypothetical protein